MGQKINPISFRLGVNRGWDSIWFAKKKEFGKYYGRITKTGGAVLLVTGILIATNQIQVISYYILTILPFLTTLG